jgi:glycopeptide antibiotics resistance protein
MKKRLLPALILILYAAILIKVMVFKDVPTIRVGHLMLNFGGTNAGQHANFLPFATIVPYLLGYKGWIIAGINLGGNIALLVPLGFLLPFVYPNITWKKNLVLAVGAGLAIEITQTVLRVGIFDIDDVILNALGVMLGYWAFILLAEWVRARKYKTISITAITGMATAAVAFYALYPQGPQPVNPGSGAGGSQLGPSSNEQDLCTGTGGTGEIVGMGKHTITIRRQDGGIQTIHLTDRTTIRTSAGPASESDLQISDHVTLVVDASETASTVLLCNVSGRESRSGH